MHHKQKHTHYILAALALSFTMLLAIYLTASPIHTIAAQTKKADNNYPKYKQLTLTHEYHSEGAHYGDINGDGNLDVISGPFWFEGPSFKNKYTYYKPLKLGIKDYARSHFATFTYDFNQDGNTDILTIALPGGHAQWFENPGKNKVKNTKRWASHRAFDNVDNESPVLGDLDNDGKPEIIAQYKGYFGYMTPNWDRPKEKWTFHPISNKTGRHRYTHGLGFGDVDGDGKNDILEKNGWWQQPNDLKNTKQWQFHKFDFTAKRKAGGAQMYAYDVDGDGDNDIITTLHAHAWGLSWFEHIKKNGKITFKEHRIIDKKPSDSPYNFTLTQMHGIALIDINGDGLKDIVTGKRYYAHNGKDPGADNPLITVWFQLVRESGGKTYYIPRIASQKCGVGVQVEVTDLNHDKKPDIVVGNKKGIHILFQE